MPHTSSRRREVKDQLHPTKLSHEVDDDGWSHVVRKSSAPSYVKSHTQSTQSTDITRIHVDFTEQLTPAQVDFLRRNIPRHALKSTEIRPRAAIYSPEELQKRFGQVQTAWSQDTVVQRLRAVLTRVGVAPTADKEHANKEESLHKDELDSKDADERPVHDEASVGHAVDVTNQLNDLSLKAETSRPIPEESTESGQAYSGLDKAICIGLGSPSADTSAWEKNVLWQLVAFLEMAKILNTQAQPDASAIALYVQDPVLNEVDIAFLSSLNVQAMSNMRAFSLIDSHAMVYAPHYQVRGWPEEMRRGEARCIIGNDVKPVLDDEWMVDKARKRRWFEDLLGTHKQATARTVQIIPDLDAIDELRDFVEKHEAIRLPRPVGDVARSAFNDTFVYWKTDQEEE